MKKGYIYTLSDPIDNEIKYIGLTTEGLKRRLKRHMLPSNLKESWTSKNKWLLWLKNNGHKPIMEVLDECDENTNIYELEMYWISQLKSWGYKLKNETIGGDRGADWTGKKHKKESVELMKKNHPFRKEICQYRIDNNELVGEYFSSHDTGEKTGYNRGNIFNCCKGTKNYNRVGDFYFRFKDSYFPYQKASNRPKYNILKYNLKGDLLNKYESGYELKNECNISFRTLIKKTNSGQEKCFYKNYVWEIKNKK